MDNGYGNWLATVITWSSIPLKALAGPWWEKYVGKKAESEAVRTKLLEAIVAFRITDFHRHLNTLDLDRARGLASRIIERLRPTLLSNAASDLTVPSVLTSIEQEIELHAVGLQAWIQLACLADTDVFDPTHAIAIIFTDDRGNRTNAMTVICELQKAYPFTQILAIEDIGRARIAASAVSLLREFCTRTVLPATTFEISAQAALPTAFLTVPVGAKQLTHGWKPK